MGESESVTIHVCILLLELSQGGDIPLLLIIDEIGRAKFRLNSIRSSRQTPPSRLR
jgi:hypothetical protein